MWDDAYAEARALPEQHREDLERVTGERSKREPLTDVESDELLGRKRSDAMSPQASTEPSPVASTGPSSKRSGAREEALHAHHEDLVEDARVRHDALTEAIKAVEEALIHTATADDGPGLKPASDALARVQRAIRSHAAGVEEQEGLFDEIGVVEPRLFARIDALREEHVELSSRANALARRLAEVQALKAAELRAEVAALLSDLRTHRAAEADLIYEAFWIELGSAD